jgi:hypothetical protein
MLTRNYVPATSQLGGLGSNAVAGSHDSAAWSALKPASNSSRHHPLASAMTPVRQRAGSIEAFDWSTRTSRELCRSSKAQSGDTGRQELDLSGGGEHSSIAKANALHTTSCPSSKRRGGEISEGRQHCQHAAQPRGILRIGEGFRVQFCIHTTAVRMTCIPLPLQKVVVRIQSFIPR